MCLIPAPFKFFSQLRLLKFEGSIDRLSVSLKIKLPFDLFLIEPSSFLSSEINGATRSSPHAQNLFYFTQDLKPLPVFHLLQVNDPFHFERNNPSLSYRALVA